MTTLDKLTTTTDKIESPLQKIKKALKQCSEIMSLNTILDKTYSGPDFKDVVFFEDQKELNMYMEDLYS